MQSDQYVVTAVYKEKGVATRSVRLVTSDPKEAYEYDVSLYTSTRWNVFVENFVVKDGVTVMAKRRTKIIYPQQQEDE